VFLAREEGGGKKAMTWARTEETAEEFLHQVEKVQKKKREGRNGKNITKN